MVGIVRDFISNLSIENGSSSLPRAQKIVMAIALAALACLTFWFVTRNFKASKEPSSSTTEKAKSEAKKVLNDKNPPEIKNKTISTIPAKDARWVQLHLVPMIRVTQFLDDKSFAATKCTCRVFSELHFRDKTAEQVDIKSMKRYVLAEADRKVIRQSGTGILRLLLPPTSAIDETLRLAKSLRELVLAKTKYSETTATITQAEFLQFFSTPDRFPNLQKLVLSIPLPISIQPTHRFGRAITDPDVIGPKEAGLVGQACPNLQSLTIYNAKSELLYPLLEQCTALTHLSLQKCQFDDSITKFLKIDGLKDVEIQTYLDTDPGSVAKAKVLELLPVKRLFIEKNPYHPARILPKCPLLESLTLLHDSIADVSLSHFASSPITELTIYNCHDIPPDARPFSKMPKLRKLNFFAVGNIDNYFTACSYSKTLEEITISRSTHISRKSMKLLGRCNHLKRVYFGSDVLWFDNISGKDLLNLRSAASLTHLGIGGTLFTTQDVIAFIRQAPASFAVLDLSNAPQIAIQEVQQEIKRSRKTIEVIQAPFRERYQFLINLAKAFENGEEGAMESFAKLTQKEMQEIKYKFQFYSESQPGLLTSIWNGIFGAPKVVSREYKINAFAIRCYINDELREN